MRTPVTEVPHRLEPFRGIGWTVATFASPALAAAFVTAHPNAAMPCWRRWEIADGDLVARTIGAP